MSILTKNELLKLLEDRPDDFPIYVSKHFYTNIELDMETLEPKESEFFHETTEQATPVTGFYLESSKLTLIGEGERVTKPKPEKFKENKHKFK